MGTSQEKPVVRIISTGGTIASTAASAEGPDQYKNYGLSKPATEIVESVPKLTSLASVEVDSVVQKESPKLLIEDFVHIVEATKRAADEGVDGVIITHGTSAIEEAAYFADLVLNLDVPVVFVGAMRPADAVNADGPGNLLTAARALACRQFHVSDGPSGVYVAMNETIHAARDVTKADTWALEAFQSGSPGPVARFTDEELQLYRKPMSYSADLSDGNLEVMTELTVPILTTAAGAQATLIEQAIAGSFDADGFVVQTTGRGGTSPEITEWSTQALEEGIPIATTSRCYYGPRMSTRESGTLIAMENLPGWKARIHLIVALSISRDIEEIRNTVAGSKYGQSVATPIELS